MNDIQPAYGTSQDTIAVFEEETCCTCIKKCFVAIKVTDLDYDGRTFLEKLKACVSPSLEVDRDNIPKICRACITTLNLSYKFRKTALHSLRTLKHIAEKVEINEQELEDIKEEPDYSDEEMHLLKDTDFDSNEIQNAVILFSQLSERESIKKYEELGCKQCSTTFQEKSDYDNHMLKVHNKPLTCELCGKAFKAMSRLKEHVASHIKDKSYNCTNCHKSFTRMSSLKRHMRTHYAPPGQKSKKTPFLCTICGKNFPFSNGATRHMRIHFGIKTHECEICHKQFNQSTHLQVHMRTHSGEKPYVCEICGESFTLKAGLHKHRRNRHKVEDKNVHTSNSDFQTSNNDVFQLI